MAFATLFALGLAARGAWAQVPAQAPAQQPAPGLPPPALDLPPRPAVIPGYAELDASTNLHMTGTPQFIDAAAWRLKVTGRVGNELALTYDELRRLPRRQTRDPIICPGYFEDYATWAGASLDALLDLAKAASDAKRIELVSADGYGIYVSIEQARSPYALLAYEWNGKALPELHGYPVRAAFPGLQGSKWVKWLVQIIVE
jgi:DMSO/TMAO reductase YedYZ molybdopterin-dependent catalytic subunit